MFPCRVTNSYLKSRLCFRLGSGSWQPAWQDEAPLPLHPRLDGFPGLHERLLFQVRLAPKRKGEKNTLGRLCSFYFRGGWFM
jgi:hypothetical protein